MKFYLHQIFSMLAAMREIATNQGKTSLSEIQKRSMRSFYKYIFRHTDQLDFNQIPNINPSIYAECFNDQITAEYSLRFLTVASLMDGKLDSNKVDILFHYADACNLFPHYLLQLKKTLDGELSWLIYDATMRNLESFDLFPNLKSEQDIDDWLFPYRGKNHDSLLAKRYENLQKLPNDSFGYGIWKQFKDNNYLFPGEEEGVNYAFVMPHDSLHVLSDYNTTPFGELLLSTFTSTMLEQKSMEGHIIPVFYSFYLGIKLNDLAGAYQCEMIPEAFWEAWYRGSQIQINLFAHNWSLWDVAEIPLTELRQKYGVLPKTVKT